MQINMEFEGKEEDLKKAQEELKKQVEEIIKNENVSMKKFQSRIYKVEPEQIANEIIGGSDAKEKVGDGE